MSFRSLLAKENTRLFKTYSAVEPVCSVASVLFELFLPSFDSLLFYFQFFIQFAVEMQLGTSDVIV